MASAAACAPVPAEPSSSGAGAISLLGGTLTALGLEDRRVFQVDCPQVQKPKKK